MSTIAFVNNGDPVAIASGSDLFGFAEFLCEAVQLTTSLEAPPKSSATSIPWSVSSKLRSSKAFLYYGMPMFCN